MTGAQRPQPVPVKSHNLMPVRRIIHPAPRWPNAEVLRNPAQVGAEIDLARHPIQQHKGRACRPAPRHQGVAARLSPQPVAEPVCLWPHQLRFLKLEHLPAVRAAIPDRRRVGPRQQRLFRDAGKAAADQGDLQNIAPVQHGWAGCSQRRARHPDGRAVADHLAQAIIRIRAGLKDGHRSGPRGCRRCQMGGMGHLITPQQGQIHEIGQHRRWRDKGPSLYNLIVNVCRIIDFRLDPHAFDQLLIGALNPVHPVERSPLHPVAGQLKHIARAQIQLRRRQRQTHRIPRYPCFRQPALHHLTPLTPRQHQVHLRPRHRVGCLIGEHGLFRDHLKIRIRLHKPQPHPARDLSLCLPRLLHPAVQIIAQRQPVPLQHPRRHPVAHAELQQTIALNRVKAVADHQRLQCAARVRHLLHRKAPHIAI